MSGDTPATAETGLDGEPDIISLQLKGAILTFVVSSPAFLSQMQALARALHLPDRAEPALLIRVRLFPVW